MADVGIIILSAKTSFETYPTQAESGDSELYQADQTSEFDELVSIYGAFYSTRTVLVLISDLESTDNDLGEKMFKEVKNKFVSRLSTLGYKVHTTAQILPINLRTGANICHRTEELNWNSGQPLHRILTVLPSVNRYIEEKSPKARLAVLDVESDDSGYKVTTFLIRGKLGGPSTESIFSVCPAEIKFRARVYEDMEGEQLEEVSSGSIFKISKLYTSPNLAACSANDFPCYSKVGRGAYISVSDNYIACEHTTDVNLKVELTLNSNASPIEKESELEFEIYFGGTYARAKLVSIHDEFMPSKYPQQILSRYVDGMIRESSYHAEIRIDSRTNFFFSNRNPALAAFVMKVPYGPIIGFGSIKSRSDD